MTESGRVYEIVGAPGATADAFYVWNIWRQHANVLSEADLTASLLVDVRAAQHLNDGL